MELILDTTSQTKSIRNLATAEYFKVENQPSLELATLNPQGKAEIIAEDLSLSSGCKKVLLDDTSQHF